MLETRVIRTHRFPSFRNAVGNRPLGLARWRVVANRRMTQTQDQTGSGGGVGSAFEHQADQFSAEVGEVIGAATGDVIAIDDDGGVFVQAAGVDQIVLDAG